MKSFVAALALCVLLPGLAAAADQALIDQGNHAFQYSCAPCHGPGKGMGARPFLPGTDALTVKYKGTQPGLLEERTNLSPELIRTVVRHGVESMPSFRKTELSDANLNAIAAYLSRNTKQ